MKTKLKLFALFAITIMLIAIGCTPKRKLPIIHYNVPYEAIQGDAMLAAFNIHGEAFRTDGHSMEPVIFTGDFVVVDTSVKYSSLSQGLMAVYQARWLPPESPPVTHWISSKQGDEWIMDGGNNAHYESDASQRMGAAEYRGIVTEIFTTRTK